MTMHDRRRVESETAFVLHTYPFRETSLLVEILSRRHGRMALIARGARRPRSALRGQLMSFQPLLISWSGKSEPRLLTRAEWCGGRPQLSGLQLLCGFYLNELLLKLLHREDPHEALFDEYAEALIRLADGGDPASALRVFEIRLLKELGYGLSLEREALTGEPIRAEEYYAYHPERGAVLRQRDSDAVQFRGRTLIQMARGDFSDTATAAESKQLLRMVLKHHLGNEELQTRQLLKDLQAL